MTLRRIKNQTGYALLGVLIFIALGLVVTAGMLDSATTNMKTRSFVKTRSDQYYEVEATLNKVVSWLQANSKYLVTAFEATNFTSNFDLGSPSLGDNEGEFFGVPTMVKLAGTNNSAMLSNNAFFGTAAFPTTEHIDTHASFDPVSEFQNADLGTANARVVLMWARESAGSYEPIFRIDVVTGNNPDRGVHSYSFVYSSLVGGSAPPGFFGQDFTILQTPNNDCWSYQYSYNAGSGTWNKGAPRANCPVASNGPINISSKVNGTAATLQDDGISLDPPGGDVSGTKCTGSSCHSYTLPVLGTWASYCPVHNGNVTITSNTTWNSGGCWQDVDIDNNRTLTLTDTTAPYYFRNLIHNGNKAKIAFGPIPDGETIEIYVEGVQMNAAGHINGNKIVNGNNAPHQVIWHYLSGGTLNLEGTTDMSALIIAPSAKVEVQGNFEYYGGILAKQLYVSGNAQLYYDEALGLSSAVTDLNFTLRKASVRYR
ncbi:MAG: hypothetical protein KDD44_09570 [Bdellovibrionales bacterium]|nr:hypothetical protein [Bdellovibrionales bacterium]